MQRIRGFFASETIEREFDSEVQTHLSLLTEENVRRGMNAEEARCAALRSFGGISQFASSYREQTGLPRLEAFSQDLRFGIRLMRKNPGFTAVAIITLALGIGANTAIFSVVNAVLLHPLPYPQPGQLISISGRQSWPDLHDIQKQNQCLEKIGAFASWQFDLASDGEPEQVKASLVSLDLFETLAVHPALGRYLSTADDVIGGPRVVVVSNGFWQRKFGAAGNVIGKTLSLSGNTYTVVGVMPREFRTPEGIADVFVPFRVGYPEGATARGLHFQYSVARLQPGWQSERAQADLDSIGKQLSKLYPEENRDRRYVIVPLHQRIVGRMRETILVLFGAVGLLLLIASLNFANLLLAKASGRREEAKMRAALGATPGRLMRQFLTESILISGFGGLAGLALGSWGTRLLLLLKPQGLPTLTKVTIDLPVLLFTLAVSLLIGLLFGLLPVMQVISPNSLTSIRTGKQGAGESPSMLRLRRMLVVGEVAISLVLVSTAGLLIRTLWQLQKTDPGFDSQSVLTAQIRLPQNRYDTVQQQNQFFYQLQEKLETLPGIKNAGLVTELPFSGNHIPHNFLIAGRTAPPIGTEPEAQTNLVSPTYFSTLSIPLLKGRGFDKSDRENAPLVAVVNESMVREHFKNQDAIGSQIRFAREPGPPKWITIVGIVGDVKEFGLDQEEDAVIYTPVLQKQEPWRRWSSIVLKSADPAARLGDNTIKSAVWTVDPAVPVTEITPLTDLSSESLSPRRFNALLLGMFAATALLLAIVGIYGVISYTVAQRTREIGVRMALGASKGDVLRLIMKQGAAVTLAGVVLGVGGTVLAGRMTASLLFNVGSDDPLTLLAAVGLLAGVALLATYIPARRAARIDPLIALRYE